MIPQQTKAKIEILLSELSGECGFVVKSLTQGIEWVFQNRRFIAASTIKLPVLLAYLEARPNLNTSPYIYQKKDYMSDSPCFDACVFGQSIEWDTIALWMMKLSDNTATNLMIGLLGLEKLQAWLKGEGFNVTELNRKMGDTEARQRGIDNWTSPLEMNQMLIRLVEGKYQNLSLAGHKQALDILHQCEDKEKIPFLFVPPIQVANKPGELPHNRSDIGYIHDQNESLVVSIFCDQLINEAEADLWIAQLAKLLWNELSAP